MPWCPKCGYEYKEGYTVCSDCGVELVNSLDEIKNEEEPCNECSDVEAFNNMSEEELVQIADEVQEEKAFIYVECKKRAEEHRAGASTLIIVGIVGAIALIMFDLGLFSIPFVASKIMINVVMGILFAVFIFMGVVSYHSYSQLKIEAQKEEETINKILDYFENNVSKKDLEPEESSDISDEEIVLRQYDIIKGIITDDFGELDPSFLEFITEKIYNIMFE